MAATRQWRAEIITTPLFDLYAFAPAHFVGNAPLVVYIEGDGESWINARQLSNDPTPRYPVALELAVADSRANVLYLARPCQYVSGRNRRNCHPAYWDTAGYSEDVIAAYDVALTTLARRAGASGIIYVGYSGGGAVAALVAARRSDSIGLVTVAGVLDHATWTRLDELGPLSNSLNPVDAVDRLINLPQIHYSGGKDKVVPTAVTRAYAARFPAHRRPRIEVVADFDHKCCWPSSWRERIAKPLPMPGDP